MPLVQLAQPHRNTPAEIAGIRRACALAKQMLGLVHHLATAPGSMPPPAILSPHAAAAPIALVGTTTADLDAWLHRVITAKGAYPSPLGYQDFPASICTSVNNVLCHGIPDARPLASGDLVNVDVTVYLDGFHGDTSATFLVGEVDEQGRMLVGETRRALEAGMAVCGPGVPFREIGRVIG